MQTEVPTSDRAFQTGPRWKRLSNAPQLEGAALGLGVIESARMNPAAAEIGALADEIRRALSTALHRQGHRLASRAAPDLSGGGKRLAGGLHCRCADERRRRDRGFAVLKPLRTAHHRAVLEMSAAPPLAH